MNAFQFPIPNVAVRGEGFALTPDHGTLTLELFYDFREKPLILTAAGAKNEAALIILHHRIELYADGILADEEWPCGAPVFDGDTLCKALGGTAFTPDAPSEPPAVTGTLINAEGWHPGGGVFVGDCMPYTDGGRYHVLYLKDRHHHRSKWGFGAHQWEHISTADFSEWQMHPMAVAIDDPTEGSICTGSWMRVGDTHYLYYTVRMTDGSPAPIRRSVSHDGWHFHKDADFGFTLSERYHRPSARDPKLIRADDGWHMLVTTSETASGRGALAHLISTDGEAWTETDPIYLAPDSAQPECPDYFCFGGRYYLVFSLHAKAHYLFSDKPFSDWREPRDPIIPAHSVPKAAIFDGRLIFTGFKPMGGYAGTMTFREAFAGETGELIFPDRG